MIAEALEFVKPRLRRSLTAAAMICTVSPKSCIN